jgi:hypothetical protein
MEVGSSQNMSILNSVSDQSKSSELKYLLPMLNSSVVMVGSGRHIPAPADYFTNRLKEHKADMDKRVTDR